jgi:hypothetical protein
MWDERRAAAVTMEKSRPKSRDGTRLTAAGWYAAFRESPDWGGRETRYAIVTDGVTHPLPEAQWADWSSNGQLLLATRDGRVQILDGVTRAVRWEVDVARFTPEPTAPPAEASRW